MNLLTISQSLDESYNKHKIIPDVVDKFDTQGLLTIEYNENDQVALGNTLKVENTQHKPTIQFTLNSPGLEKELEISKDDRFTLVLTDPDAPSNKDHKWSEYAHWIVTDLPLNENSESASSNAEGKEDSLSTILDYTKGKEILSYVGPAPPPKTGKHRYVFLLYKQDPKVYLLPAPPDRPNWGTGIPSSGVKDWIKKHGGKLQLLGINFFYAQNDDQD
ncbi:PEBP-like protein [Hyphopichia burtonii NRRL Y-1933]|uniref:PEBP-like protein n=1 Tax=Hyphopichia burtonii NRRL Y-1933 TaxID=984485 RepID=A0A1E4RT69_9ASCO|nr:PEBP-like protein [Hyphopichia burtonii NRRL Y-1933]ODV70460.1 PEBP-like protein [Hyphopichia burtonii NRRL Y-1933]